MPGAIFKGLTMGGVHYTAEQGNEIIEYARCHGITLRRAAELLAEIKGWPRPRNLRTGRSPAVERTRKR
jgi:hypothetical protein